MIEMRENKLEIKGSRTQLITEFASIARHLVKDFDFTERDFEYVHEIAFLSDEQLAEKAKNTLNSMTSGFDEEIIKKFKEFMNAEDCENCSSSDKCPMKSLYDDVLAGKANGLDIIKATMSMKETDTHKDIHKDKPNDLFGDMFNDLR